MATCVRADAQAPGMDRRQFCRVVVDGSQFHDGSSVFTIAAAT